MVDSALQYAGAYLEQHGIKDGDLIGFSGDDWVSRLIRLGTYGRISHVGIMCSGVLFESTTLDDLPCIFQKRVVSGTQAHYLQERVAKYRGRVYHLPLFRELYEHEADRLWVYLRGMIGRDYDLHGAIHSGGQVASVIEGEDLKTVFCSELIAAAYATIGLFSTTDASRFNPNRLVRWLRFDGIVRPPVRLR